MKHMTALIFDCDGVLVNSEEIVQAIELELLAEHGLNYELDEFSLRFLGTSNEYFYDALNTDSLKRLGKPLPNSFPDELKMRARRAFESDLKAYEHVETVADSWSGTLAVASSSSITGLEFKLRITGLAPLFTPHIYSADHVHAGKPDPAIYLHTANNLRVDPTSCIAVEDSVNGVISAKAAGMHTIGFIGGRHCRDGHDTLLSQAGADQIVHTMLELEQLISR